MKLELNIDQLSLIRMSIDTRIQRINTLIEQFKSDGSTELAESYTKELKELIALYETL